MDNNLIVGSPLPPTPGRCADLYHDVRELRLAMEKEVAAVQARESEIRDHIINTLAASDDTGAAGLQYRAQIIVKAKPRVADWNAFCEWVASTKRFDCIQRRTSDKAVMELIDEGSVPPGIERMQVKDISIVKI
jgi:hypothetical protein